MKSIRVGVGVLLTVLLLAVSPGSAQLVTNGGFETGDFTGWTQSGNTGFTGVGTSTVHSGTYGAFFGPMTTIGTIRQSIATTPGALYDLSFWLATGGGTPTNAFSVSWGASTIYGPVINGPVLPYTLYSFSGLVGGAGASTTLNFGFRNDPSYFYLDDVSITAENVIPEPATMTLLATGLVGMLGAGLRRRKQA